MPWLILVSLIWGFSFGLIKGRLTGVDPALVSLLRLVLALLVLAPFFRPRGLGPKDVVTVMVIGALQFGVMYVTYISAFAYLKAYEIAVLTIFTPVLVCIFEDLAARRAQVWPYVAAVLATIGAGIVVIDKPLGDISWRGIALMQLSNAMFAVGQIAYRRWRRARPQFSDARVFALAYVGAVLVTLPLALPAVPTVAELNPAQWRALLYLGIIASGVCFFLWNHGAARTAPGPLAVANNLKIPAALAFSVWWFGETGEVWRIMAGGALVIAAGAFADLMERRNRVATN